MCACSASTHEASARLISSLADHGYEHVAHTEPDSGGVLIASKTPLLIDVIDSCPSSDRWLHVAVEGFDVEICGAYIPNRERSRTENAEYWQWLIETGTGYLLDR